MDIMALLLAVFITATICFAIRASKWEVYYKTLKQLMYEKYHTKIDDEVIHKLAMRKIFRGQK